MANDETKSKSTNQGEQTSPAPEKKSSANNVDRPDKVEEPYVLTNSEDDEFRMDRLIRIIIGLIDKNHILILERLLQRLRPSDISYISEFLGEAEKNILFSLVPEERLGDILTEMSRESRSALLEYRDPGWIAKAIDSMDSDDAADVLNELSEEHSTFILKRIDKEDAEKIKELMQYRDSSAGGIMDTEFMAISHKARVSQVIAEFKKIAEKEDIEDLHSSFVIDEEGRMLGFIPLRKLVLYKGTTKVDQIMELDYIVVNVNTDQEEVAVLFKRHNLISMPVIDDDGVLVGRITIDDIVDVIDEENSEDIYRMAGVGIESSVNASIGGNIRRRFPWLVVNLLTAAVSAWVVASFESIIDQVAILAAFMPIVAGLGGNAGSQVIAIVVRAMALGELTFANAGRVLAKEIGTGASNGLLLGLVIGGATALITGKEALGLIIFMAMVLNVFSASIAGLLVPLGLKRINVDPAVASNIFVTPMTDALGFFFFLGLARIFVEHLL